MTGRLGLTFARAEELSAALGAACDQIAARLDELDHELGALSNSWSGSGAEAYQQSSAQLASSLRAMESILRTTEKLTLGVAQRHREAEAQVQALWE